MTRSDLSPLRPGTTLPPRLDPVSNMRPYAVSFTARATPELPPRPVTLTIYALGATMALLLARRQADQVGLRDVSVMRWSAL